MTAIHAMTGPDGPEGGLLLDDVARQAADVVRPGLACTVTLREFRCLRVAGSSDVRARRAGSVEQAEHSGPGLAALDERRVVVVAEIARTRRWPAWRDVALGQGFRTAVAISAPVGPGVEAAVELLGDAPDPWQRDELRRAATFATQVARLAGLQLEVSRLRAVTEELYGAFTARDTIGQATGIVMSQRTCGPDEALAVLHRAAEHRNLSLRDVAVMVVGEMARADQIGASRFAEPSSSLPQAAPPVPDPVPGQVLPAGAPSAAGPGVLGGASFAVPAAISGAAGSAAAPAGSGSGSMITSAGATGTEAGTPSSSVAGAPTRRAVTPER